MYMYMCVITSHASVTNWDTVAYSNVLLIELTSFYYLCVCVLGSVHSRHGYACKLSQHLFLSSQMSQKPRSSLAEEILVTELEQQTLDPVGSTRDGGRTIRDVTPPKPSPLLKESTPPADNLPDIPESPKTPKSPKSPKSPVWPFDHYMCMCVEGGREEWGEIFSAPSEYFCSLLGRC